MASLWLPNPACDLVIKNYLNTIKVFSTYAKEIFKNYILNGIEPDVEPCQTVHHMIVRLKDMVVMYSKWMTTLGIFGYTITPPKIMSSASEDQQSKSEGQKDNKYSQSQEKGKDKSHGHNKDKTKTLKLIMRNLS